MITRRFSAAMLAAAIAAVALLAGAPANAKLRSITIGTNPAGTTYFLLGGGLAKLFQEKLEIRSTVQPHAGSSVYLPLMDKGEITLGLNSSLDSALAYNGKEPYSAPSDKLRAVARVWILPYAYVVKENSGIRSLEDLKGKRVIVHFKTNVSLGQLNRTILATAGLTDADVTAVDGGGIVEGLDEVIEGRVVSTTIALATPVLMKAHATVPGGMRVLPLGTKASDDFMNEGTPGSYTLLAKPSPTRPFVREDTLIAAFDTYLNAGTTVGDEDAYAMAKTMYDNWKQLQQDYAPLRGTPQNGLAPSTNPLPYHPGAIKFWREAGIWTEKNDMMEKRLTK